MSSNTTPSGPSEFDLLRAVVAQHIADGLTSGNPTAAALAQSLLTELHVAGLDLADAVNAAQAKAVNG